MIGWLLFPVTLYALALVVTRVAFRRALFQRPRAPLPQPPPGSRFRMVQAADGAPVTTLYFPAADGAPTLVYFHGAGVTLSDVASIGSELARRGLGELLVEYRGYGSSPGVPSEEGLYLDASAALDALAEDGVTSEQVVLFGISLGAGVAAEMAMRGRGARLVLATPFTSAPRLVRRFAPFAPSSLVVAEQFDVLGKAARLTVPILVLHGDRDEIIPYAMGVEVARTLQQGMLVTIPGGRHTDLFERFGDVVYDAIVRHALEGRDSASVTRPAPQPSSSLNISPCDMIA